MPFRFAGVCMAGPSVCLGCMAGLKPGLIFADICGEAAQGRFCPLAFLWHTDAVAGCRLWGWLMRRR